MAGAIAVLLVVLASATWARAEDPAAVARSLLLTTDQLFPLLASMPPSDRKTAEPLETGILDELKKREIGIRPLFMLVPTRSREGGGETPPPMFALVARADGRTVVALTRPGAKVDPDDRLLFQRLVVSDLFEGRRFSLTVYEDHALSSSAAELLGVGARMMFRPAFRLFGWSPRVEMFISYAPTQGPSGYLGIAARFPEPPPPAPPLGSGFGAAPSR